MFVTRKSISIAWLGEKFQLSERMKCEGKKSKPIRFPRIPAFNWNQYCFVIASSRHSFITSLRCCVLGCELSSDCSNDSARCTFGRQIRKTKCVSRQSIRSGGSSKHGLGKRGRYRDRDRLVFAFLSSLEQRPTRFSSADFKLKFYFERRSAHTLILSSCKHVRANL